MATVDKDFRVKNGLVVEGTTATVNGEDVITTGDTTDNLDEGSTNLYFTDERAQDAVATAIGNGSHTNITITYDDEANSLSFEGSTPISTTDDLTEGSTNLYFTDQRALDATASAYDPAGSASTAETNANSYTDTEIGNLTTDDITEGVTNLYFTDQRAIDATASEYDAAGSASTVQGNLDTHTGATAAHGVTSDIVGTEDIQTISNKTLGTDLNADGKTITNLAAPVNDSDAATKLYVDSAVSGLAWKDSAHLLADSNVSLTGTDGTLVIDGHSALDSADEGYRLLLTGQTTDSENGIYVYTADAGNYTLVRASDADTYQELDGAAIFIQEGTTYGSTAWVQSNHYMSDFTGQLWTQFSGQGTYIAGTGLALNGNEFSLDADTDDVPEGVGNLYFTDQRAQDAVTVNLTTDDLTEGSTNLYFTDQRAVDALEAVTPVFTAVDINSIALQVAATATLSDTNQTAVYSWAKASYRSAKLIIKASYGAHTEVSEVIVTLDSSDNIAITEYAVVGTNGSLGTITAGINGTDVEILYTAGTATTTVKVFGTLIA